MWFVHAPLAVSFPSLYLHHLPPSLWLCFGKILHEAFRHPGMLLIVTQDHNDHMARILENKSGHSCMLMQVRALKQGHSIINHSGSSQDWTNSQALNAMSVILNGPCWKGMYVPAFSMSAPGSTTFKKHGRKKKGPLPCLPLACSLFLMVRLTFVCNEVF